MLIFCSQVLFFHIPNPSDDSFNSALFLSATKLLFTFKLENLEYEIRTKENILMDSPKLSSSRSSSSSREGSSSEYTLNKDVKVKKSKNNSYELLKELLENKDNLSSLITTIRNPEFLELVYSLFEAHNKLDALISCAVQLDLSKVSTSVSNYSLSAFY